MLQVACCGLVIYQKLIKTKSRLLLFFVAIIQISFIYGEQPILWRTIEKNFLLMQMSLFSSI